MTPKSKLVALLAAPRSGTHFLRSVLNNHPDISFFGEILNPVFSDPSRWTEDPLSNVHQFAVQRLGMEALPEDMNSLRSVVGRYIAALKSEACTPVVGIDLKYWTWDIYTPEVILEVTTRVDRWIHLLRRDLIRAEISDAIRANFHEKIDKNSQVKVTVDNPDELSRCVLRRGRITKEFRDAMGDLFQLELVYEDLFPDERQDASTIRPDVASKLLKFLDIRVLERPLLSDRIKSNPSDMSQRVIDYHELRSDIHQQVDQILKKENLWI